MKVNAWLGLLCAGLAFGASSMASADAQSTTASGLESYIAQPDASFSWREAASGRIGDAQYVEYLLTSQTWRGVAWKHQFFVLRPGNMERDARQGLLFIDGGRWKPEYEIDGRKATLPRRALVFARLAESIRAPIGVLRQVPFAPLFDRSEDALIAYTFDQYLRTGESDWPLLLPMVKSAVRAMDVMQEVVKQRWDVSLDAFTVSGASKRGWTAWLTAANDKRVGAVAPMVIDVLNMGAQLEHQRATWGQLSEEIGDYSALDLPAQLKTERGQALLAMVDPYSYRERLTQPKMILLGANDRYWPLDALKLYWPDLPHPKHVMYAPNQGHSLADVERVIGALSAVHRYSAAGKPLPNTQWSFASTPRAISIQVQPNRDVRHVRIWSARSASRDFRQAHWRAQDCTRAGERYACSALRGEQGYTAVFAETDFTDEGRVPFSTTTTVCIAGPNTKEDLDCPGAG